MSRYTGSYKGIYKPAANVRDLKRAEAEARNAKTPPERRRAYRLAPPVGAEVNMRDARPKRKGPTVRETRDARKAVTQRTYTPPDL